MKKYQGNKGKKSRVEGKGRLWKSQKKKINTVGKHEKVRNQLEQSALQRKIE